MMTMASHQKQCKPEIMENLTNLPSVGKDIVAPGDEDTCLSHSAEWSLNSGLMTRKSDCFFLFPS